MGNSGLTPYRGNRDFSLFHIIYTGCGTDLTISLWIPEALPPDIKWLGSGTDHSLPSYVEITNVWSYSFTPHVLILEDTSLFWNGVLCLLVNSY
jgi:hypothetical protein